MVVRVASVFCPKHVRFSVTKLGAIVGLYCKLSAGSRSRRWRDSLSNATFQHWAIRWGLMTASSGRSIHCRLSPIGGLLSAAGSRRIVKYVR
jgi:hypothetical protein